MQTALTTTTTTTTTRVLLLFLRLFLHQTMVIFFLLLSLFLFIYICRFIIQSRNISPTPSSPSTLTTAHPQVKYDVFLSFRGEDTRVGFASYLYAALSRKQILTFIDYQLVRGDEISASLLKTIEEAKLSVIIFSENYASSKWCLEELVKIFERRKNNGQIVIPVFYQVDPSHVRHQTGSFGDAFARLIKKKALGMDKVQSFRDALTDAANLSGWSLGESELESEFIEKIVGDVLNKLHAMSSRHAMRLIGIDVRVNKVESLLNMESQAVLIVGIWGMGGVGKTTIAEAVCDKVRSRFEGIFVANFRQELKTRSMADLKRSFLSQLLGQEILNRSSLSFQDSFVRDRLCRKKVFIVLDDVDDLVPLEEWEELLLGRHSSFGPGSKVLITSRDKQLLNNVVDATYKVERLNYEEALQLFSSKALKNCNPTIDHSDLIKRIANHVQGNPLALIVLGSSLYGKSTEEWYSALNKLAQNPRIKNALRISYDGLDQEQQSIFLDIAHFFRRWEQNRATRILDGFYDRSVIFDISTLIDKCLITTTQNMLEMHDLLQEMAFSIVRAESKFPGKRSRLCHLPDVIHVLEENKGTEEIEGISLDISKLSRQIHLKSDAFATMDGLRFLKFYFGHFSEDYKYKVHLSPTGLEYLSNKLRYFHWNGFPSKSLPQNFCAEHLVELILKESKVEKFWTGVQDVGNLRKFELSFSPYLTELPDLSMAQNLECLDLWGCSSLTEVPMLDSKVLRELYISPCLDVTKCPTISQNMKILFLEETSIKEVPQSITSKLETLSLRGCSKITKFPEISGDLQLLNLSGTAIKVVPSSIQFLTRLEKLDMSGCSKLESFPEITVPMKSLWRLNLSKTGIKEIPSSFKHMIFLESLALDGTPIKVLPELPPSLWYLTTRDCASLETIINFGSLWSRLNFANCFKMDQKQMIAAMYLQIQSGEIPKDAIQMVLPGSEIPEWFSDKGLGSSITIQLPSNCHRLKGIAFCLVFLFPLPYHDRFYESVDHKVVIYFDCHGKIKNGEHDGDDKEVFIFDRNCSRFEFLKACDSDHMFLNYERSLVKDFSKYPVNEVTFKFYAKVDPKVDNFDENVRTKVRHEIQKLFKVKSCGVYLHFDENLPADTSDEDLK